MADDKELKELEKQKKLEAKILDAPDDNFCGFISLQVVDQDGHPKMVKGCAAGGPLFVSRDAGAVKIQAFFTPNPLTYVSIERDSNLYLSGAMSYGDPKPSPLNLIGKIVPKTCESLTKGLEKSSEVEVKVEVPFLKNAPSRLASMVLSTKEEKFVTKVVGVTLTLTEEDWMEWKKYKLNFVRLSKAGTPSPGGDDDKKDEKKEE